MQVEYEYDAYGDCNVLDADYSKDADGISDYGNAYFFTGRRLDILDTASLKIMYYRNRYYDPETGRFLTHDPLGITPNPEMPNISDIHKQYDDGMSLYEYVSSNPIVYSDPSGLIIGKLWNCAVCTWKLRKVAGKCGAGQCAHVCDDVCCGDPADFECSECMATKRKRCIRNCINGIAKSIKSCVKCGYKIK